MRPFLAGLLRDREAVVPDVVAFAEAARAELPGLEVFVFENNSSDRTPELLSEAADRLPWFHARCETWDLEAFREASKARTWDNKTCRLELIAAARNTLLDWVREQGPGPDDPLAIVDLDFKRPPDLAPFVRWVRELPADVDAVFANGVDGGGRYYDLYELRTAARPLGPELLGQEFWEDRRRNRELRRSIDPSGPLIEVFSAFAGIAVYRFAALDECRYSAEPTRALHDYYLERFATDPRNPEIKRYRRRKVQMGHDGALLGAYLFDDEIFYRSNSGYNFPIAAEHVNLHLAMRARGHGRLFIAPSLRYFSDH